MHYTIWCAIFIVCFQSQQKNTAQEAKGMEDKQSFIDRTLVYLSYSIRLCLLDSLPSEDDWCKTIITTEICKACKVTHKRESEVRLVIKISSYVTISFRPSSSRKGYILFYLNILNNCQKLRKLATLHCTILATISKWQNDYKRFYMYILGNCRLSALSFLPMSENRFKFEPEFLLAEQLHYTGYNAVLNLKSHLFIKKRPAECSLRFWLGTNTKKN